MYDLSQELTVILILVVVKVREGLAVNQQTAHKFNVEGFNLKNLSELEVRKQYKINI